MNAIDVTTRNALEAVLLFYSPPPWDAAKRARWQALTGADEATTRVLCDTVRKALAEGVGDCLLLAAKIIEAGERERRGLIAQNMVYSSALNEIAGNPAEVAREAAALIATAGEPLPEDMAALEKLGNPFAH